jgi:hypothetical protein
MTREDGEIDFAPGTMIAKRVTYVPLYTFDRLANESKYRLERCRLADLPPTPGAVRAVPR